MSPFHNVEFLNQNRRHVGGIWMPSKPLPGPGDLLRRIVAAWAVLRGRAAAVEWR